MQLKKCAARCYAILLLATLPGVAIAQQSASVKAELLTRAIAKLPVMIAYDHGLYKKYGVDVQLWMPHGEYPGAIEFNPDQQPKRPEFSVDGGTPMMVERVTNAHYP